MPFTTRLLRKPCSTFRRPVAMSLLVLGLLGLAPDGLKAAPPERQGEAQAALPAFPGAGGYGMYARGGRGGDVYHVVNLNNSGPGSFRHGIKTATGPRTIVFDVGGVIELESTLGINKPYLTIAGQTAPGEGICLIHHGMAVHSAHDVVVRHIRCRPGDARLGSFTGDALSVSNSNNVIIDHCSSMWGVDENTSLAGIFDNITVQYCIIAEGLRRTSYYHGEYIPGHKGHSMGSLIKPQHGDGRATYHHNLWASNNSRNPAVGSYRGSQQLWADIRNNVIHNCPRNGYSSGKSRAVYMNYVGNYLIAGPSTNRTARKIAFEANAPNNMVIWQADNRIDGNRNGRLDGTDTGWKMFRGNFRKADEGIPMPAVATDTAEQAYRRVLAGAGALPWRRDPVDQRIIDEVISQTGDVIDSQDEVGGYPQLPKVHRPADWDTDGDGMPDWWERRYATDPDNADNNSDPDGDGYTNLEAYLNGIPHSRQGE